MTRNDEIGGNSRFDAAKDALRQAAPQLRRLQRQVEVHAFVFDHTITPLDLHDGHFTNLPEVPRGQETAIGYVLDTIREQSAGKRVLANIMLTDGAQRTRPSRAMLPQDAAARLRDSGMPLYAVPLGQAGLDGNTRDIAIVSMHANDRVFVKNNLVISGTLRIAGFAHQTIPIELLFETERGQQQVVAHSSVQAGEDGQEVRFSISYAPQTVGLYKYTVRVPPQEREITDRNNEQSSFVQVLEGGLQVLHIRGAGNFEQRPLRASLDASPDINVQYLRIRRPGDLANALRETPVPFNVFILDDIDSSMFTRAELQTLVDQIRGGVPEAEPTPERSSVGGAGLIMLGGLNAFCAGGYADTPLANVSPVELRRTDRLTPGAPTRPDLHWPATHPIPMLLTPPGQRHYVMQFEADPQLNARRWANLPPLLGANRFDRLKPAAVPLAMGQNGQILLAAQMYGSGRVLAFAGDSTYRWPLWGFEEEHKTFWRQVVLWLAKMEGGGSGMAWIVLENNRLFPGDSAQFQIFLRSEIGDDIRHFPATASVLKSDNSIEAVALISENGIPTGIFRSTEFSGDYLIQAEAMLDGEPRQAIARFLVQDRNLELDNPIAYPRLLSEISTNSGGRSVMPEHLGALFEELLLQSHELVEKRETKSTLFDSWYVLLAFILILSTEWMLRKYWGLA